MVGVFSGSLIVAFTSSAVGASYLLFTSLLLLAVPDWGMVFGTVSAGGTYVGEELCSVTVFSLLAGVFWYFSFTSLLLLGDTVSFVVSPVAVPAVPVLFMAWLTKFPMSERVVVTVSTASDAKLVTVSTASDAKLVTLLTKADTGFEFDGLLVFLVVPPLLVFLVVFFVVVVVVVVLVVVVF